MLLGPARAITAGVALACVLLLLLLVRATPTAVHSSPAAGALPAGDAIGVEAPPGSGEPDVDGPPGAEADEVVVHVAVDDPAADDDNPGSDGEPVRTIARAIDIAVTANKAGRAVRVVIAPGMYRESIELPGDVQGTTAPLVIEGYGASVSGADVLDAPTADGDDLLYQWPHDWGVQPLPSGWEEFWAEAGVDDVVRRREVVLADGQILRQVLDADQLAPGRFHVDEARDVLRVRLPADVDPTDVVVEAAVRPRAFGSNGWDGFTLRGLTFLHAATPMQRAVVVVEASTDVEVEDVTATLGSWAGLALRHSDDVVIRGTTANRNGVMGFALFRVTDADLIDVENSANNWRGDWGGYHTWEAGSKVLSTRDVRILGWRAVDNLSHGLWIDYDNVDLTIDGAYIARNRGHGLYLEANQGPITVTDVEACGNRTGIFEARSEDVTVDDVVLHGNTTGQLVFSGEVDGRVVTPMGTDEELVVHSDGWTVENSTLIAVDDQPVIGTTLPVEAWQEVLATLSASGNRYGGPRPTAFQVPGGVLDLPGWQGAVGQDLDSSWSAESARSC